MQQTNFYSFYSIGIQLTGLGGYKILRILEMSIHLNSGKYYAYAYYFY